MMNLTEFSGIFIPSGEPKVNGQGIKVYQAEEKESLQEVSQSSTPGSTDPEDHALSSASSVLPTPRDARRARVRLVPLR